VVKKYLPALETLVKSSVWSEQLSAVLSCCSSMAASIMESFRGKIF